MTTELKTPKAELKYSLLRILQHGSKNAISGKKLAQICEERDTRRIRLAIQELIKEGIPVIGLASDGYFIAETAAECEDNLEVLKSYLKMIGSHYKYLKRASINIRQPNQLRWGI